MRRERHAERRCGGVEEDANDDMEARLARATRTFMALESAQQAGEGGDHLGFALYDEGIRCLQEGKRLKRQLEDEPSAQLLRQGAGFFEARQTAKELSDDAATGTAAPAPEAETGEEEEAAKARRRRSKKNRRRRRRRRGSDGSAGGIGRKSGAE